MKAAITLRDLDPAEQAACVFVPLRKGDGFHLNNERFTVISRGPKQLRFRSKTRIITIKFIGLYIYGNGKASNFMDDLEGQITLDLLNENNPLHELSDVYKLAVRGLELQKQELVA